MRSFSKISFWPPIIANYNKFFDDLDGATTLPDNPPLNVPFPIPPSDNAFAFQCDFDLNAGESVTVNSQFNDAPVPEPSGLFSLIGLGILGGISLTRRVK